MGLTLHHPPPKWDAFLLSFKMIIPWYVSSSKMMLGALQLSSSSEVNNMFGGWSRRQEDWSPFMQHLRASNNTLRSAYNNLLSTHTALGGHLVNGHYACHNCFNPYHLRFNRIVITLHLSSSIFQDVVHSAYRNSTWGIFDMRHFSAIFLDSSN